jgi:hypothetical protein
VRETSAPNGGGQEPGRASSACQDANRYSESLHLPHLFCESRLTPSASELLPLQNWPPVALIDEAGHKFSSTRVPGASRVRKFICVRTMGSSGIPPQWSAGNIRVAA